MNETFYRRGFFILIALVFVLGTGAGWLFSRQNRKAEELAQRGDALQSQFVSTIGQLGLRGDELRTIGADYKDLERRYRELGAEIPGFTDRLTGIKSGLGDHTAGLRRIGVELQSDIDGLGGLAESIRKSYTPEEQVQNNDSGSGGGPGN